MTGTTDLDRNRLRRLLGGDDLAWLLDRARGRLARGMALTGTVTRSPATAAERAAVARLLGRPVRAGSSVSVSFDDVAAVVTKAGLAADLRSAIEALIGPVADRVAAGEAERRSWQSAVDAAKAWAAPRGLEPWLDAIAGNGLLRRQAGGSAQDARRLLDDVGSVVAQLPADAMPLARFAAAALGDAKALDRDRPVSALAVAAAGVLGGVAPRDESQTAAAWRHEAWASVGVLVGGLPGPVLTLGLRGEVSSTTGRLLAIAADAGEPLYVTLRQMLGDPPGFAVGGRRVWVCENPSVVAVAADALGTRCSPLVCTDGQPSTAVATLLRQLVGAGAVLAYHGDFDWPGIQMANSIVRRYGAMPWRMTTSDYEAAAARSRRELQGPPVPAAWDDALTPSMADMGVRVEEELVVDDLLDDLAG